MRAGQRSIPARYLSIVIECPLPGLDNGWISLPFSRTFRLAYVMNVSWGRSRGRVRIDRINMSDMCALCVDSCQTVIVCVCLIWASVDAVIVSPSWSCDVERVSSFDPFLPYPWCARWVTPPQAVLLPRRLFLNWTATELRTTTIPLLFIYHLYKYMLHLDCMAILNMVLRTGFLSGWFHSWFEQSSGLKVTRVSN